MKAFITATPKRTLLLGLVLLALVAALAGGTVAFFSSSATATGNTFAAGTLELALTQQQGGSSPQNVQSAQWDFTNMSPGGDAVTSSVWLRNIGTIEGATLSVAGDFSNDGSSPSQVAIARQMRITELSLDGQNLLEGGAGPRDRVYPEISESQCDAIVQSGESIQAALTAASTNDTVCVEAGTYTGALEIMTDGITLVSLAGAEATIIDADGGTNGIAIGTIGSGSYDNNGTYPDNVRVQGFTVENWAQRGIGQRNGAGTVYVYDNIVRDAVASSVLVRAGIGLSGGNSSEVIGNQVTVPEFGTPPNSSAGILLMGTSDAFVTDNTVNAMEYGIIVAGYPDWANLDPSWTESRGVLVAHNHVESARDGIAIAGNSDDTTVELNDIIGGQVAVNQFEQVGGTPGDDNVVRKNNFIGNSVAVRNNASGTSLNAQNNWWDGFTPETSGSGDVDTENFAGGPFLGLVAGEDPNGNGYADLDDLRLLDITGITPGLDPYDSGEENDKEFILSVQLDGPTTGNEFQGAALNEFNVEFGLNQI